MDRGNENQPKKEDQFDGTIRLLTLEDVDALRPILEQWIRTVDKTTPRMEDIDKTQESMRATVRGENTRKYRVAEYDGKVIGVMGYKIPDPDDPNDGQKMLAFKESKNPVEFINAYVDESHRAGKGVGKALFTALENLAREQGFSEILVNSGPNFEKSGWEFWDSIMGPKKRDPIFDKGTIINHVGFAKDMYGPGRDAPVWRKTFGSK